MAKPQIHWVDEIVDQAHHGTDLLTADKIVAEGKFEPSRGPRHWLGDGVYFFQGSFGMAVFFGKQKAKENQNLEYAVLRASVLLGKCLDLTTERYRKQLGKWIELLRAKTTLPLNRAWIVNSFARNGCGGFDTVRCRFPPGLPAESSLGFSYSKTSHIQISVLKVANISNIVCVRKGKR